MERIVDISGKLIHQTEMAYFLKYKDGKDPVWIPKSVGEWDEDSKEMTMPEEYAIDKGLV